LPIFAGFYRGFYQVFPLSWQKCFLPWQKPNPGISLCDEVARARFQMVMNERDNYEAEQLEASGLVKHWFKYNKDHRV